MLASAIRTTNGFRGMARRILAAVFLIAALGSTASSEASDQSADETAIRDMLIAYHVALTSGDMEKIAVFVVTDKRFAMVEGKHTNWGWADYRDNHLAGELADLQKVDLTLDIRDIQIDGGMAFASFTFAITPKGDPTKNYGVSRATAIMIRENGNWLIRHLHTS